jgi:uncharacterized protein
LNQAWRVYDELYNDPRVAFLDEPNGVEPLWRSYTQHRTFSPKVWNDAYLAAVATAGGLEMVTFDRGFEQFELQRLTILA